MVDAASGCGGAPGGERQDERRAAPRRRTRKSRYRPRSSLHPAGGCAVWTPSLASDNSPVCRGVPVMGQQHEDQRNGGAPRAARDGVPLRVIIADDDAMARRVVRDALQEAGITVIAEAADGREAIELTAHYKPDVVVMDIVMPSVDGLEATRRITERVPGAKVVMLTSTEDVDLGLVGLRAGAVGFLSKAMPPESLAPALRAAADGEAVVSRRMTTLLVETVRRLRDDGAGLRPVRSPLTPREWEVLDLLCDSLSTEEIADRLFLSEETVRSHVKKILRKLGVRSRKDAVERAKQLRVELMSSEGLGSSGRRTH